MANALIAIFGLCVFIKIFLEIKEVIFIKDVFGEGAIFMSLEDYRDAAIYSIYKHTINIFNALISLFLVVFWLSGGLFIINFLFFKQHSMLSQLEILFTFFAINYILTMPINIWEKHIDKKFGFNVASWSMFFVDEINTFVYGNPFQPASEF
jgi:STE24 endopeptidase